MKTMLKTAVALGALILSMNCVADDGASDGKLVRKIPWSGVPLPKGTSLSKDGSAVIVEHGEAKPVNFALLSLENPGIHAKAYALRCSVRYSDVESAGYLEMWNVFPAGEEGKPDLRAFSRTMGQAGPMAKITGTTDWRPAILPFNADGAKGDLKKLEVNLFLPGKGRVEIKDVELVEFGDAATMWQLLQRATDAMLAPPSQPALNSAKDWPMSGIASLGLVSASAMAMWFIVKKRRDTEQRRMKALDAM